MATLIRTGIATSAPPGRRRVTRALVPAVPVVVPLTMRLLFPASPPTRAGCGPTGSGSAADW
jgi:hypothetical protein